MILFIPAVFLIASTGFAQTSKSISVQPAPVYKGKRLYSNSWAVVIGVNRYRHPRIPTLRYARKGELRGHQTHFSICSLFRPGIKYVGRKGVVA